MPAGYYNFTGSARCEQGATFSRVMTVYSGVTDAEIESAKSGTVPASMAAKKVNLTGYTARMQVRETASSASIILSLTTENGGITLGGSAGTVTITISATETAALTAGSYVYDLELISGSTVYRRIQGDFDVDAEVTR